MVFMENFKLILFVLFVSFASSGEVEFFEYQLNEDLLYIDDLKVRITSKNELTQISIKNPEFGQCYLAVIDFKKQRIIKTFVAAEYLKSFVVDLSGIFSDYPSCEIRYAGESFLIGQMTGEKFCFYVISDPFSKIGGKVVKLNDFLKSERKF